jgi:hypothetical protein
MRVKVVGNLSGEELKFEIIAAIDELTQLGIKSFSGANLYMTLRGEDGNEVAIQNASHELCEMMVRTRAAAKKIVQIEEDSKVKDFSKARNKKMARSAAKAPSSL